MKGHYLFIQQKCQCHEWPVQENPFVISFAVKNIFSPKPKFLKFGPPSIDIKSCLLALRHAPVINYNVGKWTPYPLKLDELF